MRDALQALSEQHGVPSVDLTAEVIPIAVLRLLPEDIARERVSLPFALTDAGLHVAMSSPDDGEALEEIGFVSGKTVIAHVALDWVLQHVIEHAYAAEAKGLEYFVGSSVTEARLAELGLPGLEPSPPPPTPSPPSEEAAPPPPQPPSEEVAQPPSQEAAQPQAPSQEVEQPQAEAAAQPPVQQRAAIPIPPTPAGVRVPVDDSPLDPPLSLAPRSASERATLAEPEPGFVVLVADADAGVRELLRSTIEAAGGAVLQASDGLITLELVRSRSPQALVVDTALPTKNGLDLCRALADDPKQKDLALFVMSDVLRGWRAEEDLREGFGVKRLFDKPLDAIELTRTVQTVLAGGGTESQRPLSPAAEGYWSRAMTAFEGGDLEKAIAELEEGTRTEPRAFELHYHLGLLHGRRQDVVGAMRALHQALSLRPRDFAALKNLAVVSQRAGLRRQALETWERALSVAPDDQTRATIKQHMVTLLSE
jgi:DNA-binding response OmpR family regulator